MNTYFQHLNLWGQLFWSLYIILVVLTAAKEFLERRKLSPNEPSYAWIDRLTISEKAKEIRLKEFKKETAKPWTYAWVHEFWQGNRTMQVMYCLYAIGFFIIITPISLTAVILLALGIDIIWMVPAIVYFYFFLFLILAWWKCSKYEKTLTKINQFLGLLIFVSMWPIFVFNPGSPIFVDKTSWTHNKIVTQTQPIKRAPHAVGRQESLTSRG